MPDDSKFKIEYLPPERREIYLLAREVCHKQDIQSHEMIHGLADFLEICARIKAKQMSSIRRTKS